MPIEILMLKLFTVKEASEILNISTKEIKAYLRGGRILGAQIDGTWYIPEANLRAFMTVNSEREKLQEEVLKVKQLFDDFLKKGDITRRYYEGVMARLNEFVV